MATVHIIGAGMSGLACAVRCALAGKQVAFYEAAPQAGGRARSFVDEGLGCMVDNGSHMLLGANRSTRDYLSDISSNARISEIKPATYPFLDVRTGESWLLRPAGGWLPHWLLNSSRRVPGSKIGDYAEALSLARAGAGDTVADCVDTTGVLYERLWQPMTRAVLNADAREASARMLWRTVAETMLKGEAASRPLVFREGLSPTLVDPALELLGQRNADIRLQARARRLRYQDGRVIAIYFSEGLLGLESDDSVVLAVPPDIAQEMWPAVIVPRESRPIVNVHYRVSLPVRLPGGFPMLGLIGTESQWIFTRGDVLSVTVSTGIELVERPNWEIADLLWSEVTKALKRNMGRLPPWRVIKERRATMAQTPAEVVRRPDAKTGLNNLFLAGDWTATGLPCTIESAIRSGFTAAALAIRAVDKGPADN